MTRRNNARLAGAAYILYILFAYPGMVIASRATRGDDIMQRIATITAHTSDLRIAMVLSFLGSMCAVALAISLYAITRDEDQDIALAGMACRLGESVLGAATILAQRLLVDLVGSPVTQSAYPLVEFLINLNIAATLVSASFFAVGSALFTYLLLRGRVVPVPLGFLGFAGSLAIAFALPLHTAGYVGSSAIDMMFIPVGAFEVLVALWFIFKGVRDPRVANLPRAPQLAPSQ